ncbi:hypothetical protein Skr01_22940 [Sphaerisporangium krabiense]|uniref:Thiol-disulfide isomerase/thioredoxin n=1 Tax=Sphaerisporangium krabiense TaxID=763782 RepID=A0A7W9DRF4_9ACTN|nr:hypothetical protein [Sphaerisporangium krabiense]MBB5628044.1 thiol-disulfide isomerase/thioredoxin [Sphaerisporangium krabiense]GII62209.1 hypothetical protein Skr01_22940 [Sphaerisporangium krabiense]
MPFLIAAVACIGLLCLLDLILTLGVIKRLREHTELLATRPSGGAPMYPAVGEEVGEFSTATVEGRRLSRADLDDETLVGFFSPECQPCKEKLPGFVEFARSLSGGRERVLAVIVSAGDDPGPFLAALSPVARVVVEEPGGALSGAFMVGAYPALLRVTKDGGGRLIVTSNRVALDEPVAAK